MIDFKLYVPLCAFMFFGLCLSCKTKDLPSEIPPSSAPVIAEEENPTAHLFFNRLEAENVERLSLYFILGVENPRSAAAVLDILDWHIHINDQELSAGAVLTLDADERAVEAADSAQFLLRLDLDMDKHSPSKSKKEDFTEYQATLQVHLDFTFDTGDTLGSWISTEAAFPRIREPEFTIISIAVSRAERSNTRFRVSLQIDNPNIFPLELSFLAYELYGDGRLWADGQKTAPLYIPANSSAETQLFLLIDFIDISRNLQNQLLSLKQVHYRLTGETTVLTNLVYLPRFRTDFDLSGDSNMMQ